MPSEIGRLIRGARLKRGLSLRGLAKEIGKSPSYIVAVERAAQFPGSSDETLLSLAAALGLDKDVLFAEASRSPAELQPASATELGIQRLVKQLTEGEKEALLSELLSRTAVE